MAKMSLREKMKAAAAAGVKQSQESTDYRPTSYKTFYTVPDGMSYWTPRTEDKKTVSHTIDIIPFPATPEKMPDGFWPSPKERRDSIREFGAYHILEVATHRNVGPADETVICPKDTFKSGIAVGDKSGCPICEDLPVQQKIKRDAGGTDEEVTQIWKDMKTIRRCLYMVVVRDDGEEEAKGVQLWCVPHYSFQREIDAICKRKSGLVVYSDPDDGKSITFTMEKNGTNLKYGGFSLEDRVKENPVTKKLEKYVIEDEILEQAMAIEDMLVLHSYEELEEMYFKGKQASADEESKPADEPPPTTGTRSLRRGRLDQKEEPPKEDDEKAEDGEKAPFDDGGMSCPNDLVFGKDCLAEDICGECPIEIFEACQEESNQIKAKIAASRRKAK